MLDNHWGGPFGTALFLFPLAMIKIIIPLLLFFASFVSAQKLIFSEDFNDNRHVWIEGDNESRSGLIKDGHYHIEYKKSSKSWNFWNHIPYFSNKKDFKLECRMKLTSVESGTPHTFIWGLKNAYNYHGFSLSGNGYFRIHSWVDSQFVSVKSWTKHNALKTSGEYNTVRIQAIGSTVYYYVNDSLLYKAPKPSLFGPKIGFNLEKNQKLSVDYVKAWQDLELNLVANAKQGRVKENLGPGVNTEVNEIMPIVSPDAKIIYFVRKNYEGNTGRDKKDDVWLSNLQEDGTWSKALNIGLPINNDDHNFIVYASADGQTLIVGNKYKKDGNFLGKGISLSRKVGDKWSMPEPIEVENYINKDKHVSISFSANRKIMVLSITGKDCYGYKDLYVSFQIDETHYTEPLNLGPDVNTFLDETSPFLAADEKTLYFSSEGHMGYGSADVFVSRRLDNSWTKWSEPQNLGPEINTENWDAYYNIPAVGEKAYMVSSDSKLGNTDVISIEIPKAAKPNPVAVLSGRVLHGISKKPLNAEVSFYNGESHKETGLSNSDSISGYFKIVIPLGNVYEILTMKKGYYAGTAQIDLENVKSTDEKKFDIYLYPLEKGIVIPIERMTFANANQPSTDAIYETDRLVHLLEQYPDMKIELQGAAKNNKSFEQAAKIAELMKKAAVNPNRISISSKAGNGIFSFSIQADRPLNEERIPLPQNFNLGMDLSKIKAGQSFRIDKLYFMADSSSFTPNSIRSLDDLADFLIKNPNIQVEIGGHTNGLPAHAYCDRLSAQRAGNVLKHLMSKGVKQSQLSAKGYGKRLPLADNSTEYGRRLNQRVEVKVLKVE